MAWRRIGDKPISEPMMVNLLMQIYVTCPQWVNIATEVTSKPRQFAAVFSTFSNLVGAMKIILFWLDITDFCFERPN